MGNENLGQVIETNVKADETQNTNTEINGNENQNLNVEVNENQNNEQKEFSVEDINFEDTYKIGEYDLSKYKDIFEEDKLYLLDEYAKKYAEKGFTQEQVEFLIDEALNENKPRTKEEVIKELNNYLTIDEKRNYQAVGYELKSILEKDGLGKYYEEAMSNPIVFKLINSILKNRKGENIGVKTEKEGRKNAVLNGQQGVEAFNDFLKANVNDLEKIEKMKKEIRSKLANEKEINYFNEIVGL